MTSFKREKVGLPAGSLVHTGQNKAATVIQLTRYTEDKLEERSFVDPETLSWNEEGVTWIEVIGLDQAAVIEQIGKKLGLHSLALEDLMNVRHRPKVDDYNESGIFITMRLLDYDEITGQILDEQISFFLRSRQLITFYERPTTIFAALKERIRTKKGSICKQGADFLAYAVMDTVVDYYFIALNKISAVVDHIEENVANYTIATHLKDIHDVQRQIVFLRKSIAPVREVIDHLLRIEQENPILTPATRFYLRDVYDHTVQVVETLDLQRDLSRGLLEIAISSMSNRMNEVIKILTIVSTIFVPLTFITSLYGMNFAHMPELNSRYGYVAVWVVMIGVALFMIRYFHRKKWI